MSHKKEQRNALVLKLRWAGLTEQETATVATSLFGETVTRQRAGQIARETMRRLEASEAARQAAGRKAAKQGKKTVTGRPRLHPRPCPLCGAPIRGRHAKRPRRKAAEP